MQGGLKPSAREVLYPLTKGEMLADYAALECELAARGSAFGIRGSRLARGIHNA